MALSISSPELLLLTIEVISELLLPLDYLAGEAWLRAGKACLSNSGYFHSDSWIHLILVHKTFLFPLEDTEIFDTRWVQSPACLSAAIHQSWAWRGHYCSTHSALPWRERTLFCTLFCGRHENLARYIFISFHDGNALVLWSYWKGSPSPEVKCDHLVQTRPRNETNPVPLPREPQELQLPEEARSAALLRDPVVTTEEHFPLSSDQSHL